MTDIPYSAATAAPAARTARAAGAVVSHMDWPAALAGAIVAVAVSLVMLSFGSGIGLSLVSAEPGEGVSATVALVAAALWFVWVQISGFLAGGYLAGRLRARLADASPHEVEMRDAAHGVVVWAVGVVLAAIVAATGVSSALGALGAAAATAAETAAGSGAVEYAADRALRPVDGAAAAPPGVRAEVGRVIASAVTTGELPADDRAYLVSLASRVAGVSPEEAEARAAQVESWVRDTTEAAREAAETARYATVLAAFLTAATLLVGAVAAAIAAQQGGRHRDDGVEFPGFSSR